MFVECQCPARIGVISDTHGLLRNSVRSLLSDVDLIIHAGDVGSAGVLQALNEIAPLAAVRGNVDHGPWANELPSSLVVRSGSWLIHVLHVIDDLDIDPVAAEFHAVVYGHTHQPDILYRDDVLYLNPGSVGPRRFDLPISAAVLKITEKSLEPELVSLPQ